MADRFLEKVEALKAILVARATGEYPDDAEYMRLRSDLISEKPLREMLPRFVLECRNLLEFWDFIAPIPGGYAGRRTFLRTEFAPLLMALETEDRIPGDGPVSESIQVVDSASIHEAWQKALERRSTDPEGAITSARTLVESVCKHILDATGVTYEDEAKLPTLYKLTSKCLNLAPGQHTERVFKQILSGCHSVVEGLGSLRNHHGDAHGKGTSVVKPAPRHAELAVNLSGAMASFLLQTWKSGPARKTSALAPGGGS